MTNVVFDAYASSRVPIIMENISVIYHTAILEDWNKSIAEENIYATDLTQEEKNDAFFNKDLPADLNEQINIVWHGFGKI